MTTTFEQPLENSAASQNGQPVTLNSKKAYEELIAKIKKNYDSCRNQRSQIERSWYLNMAFFYGFQNIAVIKSMGTTGQPVYRFQTPKAPYWRARPVVNKIRPIIRKELAKLVNQRPSVSVIPATSDDTDLFAAQCGEQIWESLYDRKKIHSILRRAVWWSSITGTGFIKDWWDTSAVDLDSEQRGDICFEPVTPFHVFIPDTMEEDIEGQPYVIHASVKGIDWAKMHYPVAVNGEPIAPNVRQAKDIMENAFLNLIGTQEAKPDGVLVLEQWVKPGFLSDFPDGGLFTLVGDQLVQAVNGFPYSHGEFPFAKLVSIPSSRFYGDSVVTDLISPQREINRTHGQIIEAKNRMAKPQLMAVQGSVNPAQISTEPGQVILVKPGFQMPSPLPLTPLPSYVENELERLNNEMADISGQHEVSKGQVPPGVTAATAISYLQEQDDTMLHTAIESEEEAVEKIARHTLAYVKDYWDTPRKVKVTGTDGSFDTMMFEASDLRGNTDIRVEAGSALPTSKAAKQAFIMDLMKMGFIDPDKGLEVMEIGGIKKLYDQVQRDIRQAQRENMRMQGVTPEMIQEHLTVAGQEGGGIDPETGQQLSAPPIVPVNSWDNHQLHIQTHDNYRKSQSFEMAPQHVKAIFEEHVRGHVLAIASAQMGGPPTPDMLMKPTEEVGGGAPPPEEEMPPPEQLPAEGGPM